MDDLWATKSKDVWLIVCTINFQDFQPMWSRSSMSQTDGQIDDIIYTTLHPSTGLCCVPAGFLRSSWVSPPVCVGMWGHLQGDTRMSYRCSPSFGFYSSTVEITKADTPTIRMDCHPILINWHPNLCHPHHFTPGALPGTTVPYLSWLGTGTKYAGGNPCSGFNNMKL